MCSPFHVTTQIFWAELEAAVTFLRWRELQLVSITKREWNNVLISKNISQPLDDPPLILKMYSWIGYSRYILYNNRICRTIHCHQIKLIKICVNVSFYVQCQAVLWHQNAVFNLKNSWMKLWLLHWKSQQTFTYVGVVSQCVMLTPCINVWFKLGKTKYFVWSIGITSLPHRARLWH